MKREDVISWLRAVVAERARGLPAATAKQEQDFVAYIEGAVHSAVELTPFAATPAAAPDVPAAFLHHCRSCEFYERLEQDTTEAIYEAVRKWTDVPKEWASVKQGSWACVGTPDSPFNVARLLAGQAAPLARWDWTCRYWKLAEGRTYEVQPLPGKEAACS